MHLQDLPPDARPREKLLARGAAALADAELLALLLRTGIRGKGVLQMAHELLHLKPNADGTPGFDGIAGLLNATGDDLRRIKGLTDVAAIKMPVSDGAPQPWLAIVSEAAPSLEEINAWIETSIPGELGSVQFARLFQLDSIPLTASGKVARQQLREILSSRA